MRRAAIVLVGAALLAACAQGLQTRDVTQYSIEDFLGTVNYSGASFSPDKSKILVSSDAGGVYNAYAIPATGGEPQPLTESTTNAIFAESYFPADERILYSSDQGGNERTHLYVREIDGSVRDLTPGDKLKATFQGWAADEQSFFVGTNERDERFFDIYEYAVDGYQRTLLFQDDVGYQLGAVSPDKRYLALQKARTTADSDVYVRDRQTGETMLLTEHDGDVSNAPQAFSRDSKGLYCTTDEGGEFAYLVRYDLENGGRETVLQPDWDVLYGYPTWNGRYLVVGINQDARTEIRLFDAASMKPVELTGLPREDIVSVTVSRDEKTMAFYVSGASHPRDLMVYDFGSSEPRQLTTSLSSAINEADLVEGKVVRFPSYDNVEVPGILYRPHQASSRNKVPALVWVHGGPGGQSRLNYSALLQYLVNHGYAVYAINNRGSSGYGKTFYKMDDRQHGEADLGDCVASKKMLRNTGYVDPERIGIIGGSYGGYMVLAALTLQPEEFRVGVDIFGISNWKRTLESIPAWWESFREALYKEMGDPAEDQERLQRISPIFHADRIVRPLMVLQGANDPRVLKVESDDIVEAARANGVPVEYVVFDDEGHGFRRKENQLKGYSAILAFLDQHLKGSGGEGVTERQ